MSKDLQDILVRGTAWNNKLRVFATRTTNVTEEMRRRHDMFPTATAALGRTAAVGFIMGAMLKGEERLVIQVKGDGPIGQVVVNANAKGELRGYVDYPQAHHATNKHGKLDVAGAVGTSGFIHVTKDLGLKEPYRGSVPIVSGELGEDFTYYFSVSEQTPSVVAVGVLVDSDNSVLQAGGLIIQVLPGLSDADITRLEEAVAKMPSVTQMLSEGKTPEQMLEQLLGEDFVIHEQMDLVFKCNCSYERLSGTLISVGAEELQSMIDDNETIELVCHFCNEKYYFTPDQIKQLKEQAR